MNKLRVLIADDEPLARERIRTFLRTSEPDVEIVADCGNGPDALAAIRNENPDLVFLDVQMPGCDGLEVLERLPANRHPAVILVTAHDRFAVDAFEARVTDFLLKPFDRKRFHAALRRATEQVTERRESELGSRVESLFAQTAGRQSERLAVKADGRIVFLNPTEIVWVEAANNYAILHLTTAKRLILRETLTAFEKRLGTTHFARVNRSSLVHVAQVHELQPAKYGDYTVVLRDGTRLSLSRNLRGQLEKLIPNVP